MRILILHNYYQHRGGEDIVVEQEATALRERGHEVIILSEHNKRGIQGIIQYGLYIYNNLISNKILHKVKAINPDIVHVHNLHYAIGPAIIRKLKKHKFPVVMTLHNFRLLCPSATLFYANQIHTESIEERFPWTAIKNKALDHSLLKTFLTAFTYRLHDWMQTWQQVNYFFLLSSFSISIFKRSILSIKHDKFVLKANAIDHIPHPLPQKEFNSHYIYVGRLSEEKGIKSLLEAFKDITSEVRIYGDGPLRREVEKYAAKYPNIQFLGFKEKHLLVEEVNKANALLVPSICYESMPMGVLEAFAVGTPVLCSNLGILTQMITPKHTGLHFEANSPYSIRACIQQWNELPIDDKTRMSINCYKEANEKYNITKTIAILEKTYQKAIQENE